jgi:CubicO group peptidase (beta-lactamase class C family)
MSGVEGLVEPGFEKIADAFATNFVEHGEVGAAFCLYVEGERKVDIWGGVADAETGKPYQEDTLQLIFSSTKGATALCANLLAQRGLLDIDAPVASYWREFAAAGKDRIPVRWLLCHKAGLAAPDGTVDLADCLAWDPICAALAAQSPLWEPGSAHGYHAVTYGYLVGEVVRRITGRSLGTFFQEEVAEPLGLDFWIGLPEEEHSRVAPLVGGGALIPTDVSELDPAMRELIEQFTGPDSLLGRALSCSGAFGAPGVWNRPDVWSAEVPAANGVADARSVAKMYAATIGAVDGREALLTETQRRAATERQTEGSDRVLFVETGFGLGYMVKSSFSPFGGRASFGHYGAGGSMGCADPDHGLGIGYVMNKMQQNLAGDPRTMGLIRTTYDAVGAQSAL